MNHTPSPRAGIFAYLAALLGAFLIMFALVKAMQHYTSPPPVNQERAAERRQALIEMRAATAQELQEYGWRDQGKGLIRLPVARAMEVALQEWKNPAAARSNLIARVEKATAAPPKPPEEPSIYE